MGIAAIDFFSGESAEAFGHPLVYTKAGRAAQAFEDCLIKCGMMKLGAPPRRLGAGNTIGLVPQELCPLDPSRCTMPRDVLKLAALGQICNRRQSWKHLGEDEAPSQEEEVQAHCIWHMYINLLINMLYVLKHTHIIYTYINIHIYMYKVRYNLACCHPYVPCVQEDRLLISSGS